MTSQTNPPDWKSIAKDGINRDRVRRMRLIRDMEHSMGTFRRAQIQNPLVRPLVGSPRRLFATGVSFAVLVLGAFVLPDSWWGGPLQLVLIIGAWVFIVLHGPFDASWLDKLDSQLHAYDPGDKEAYTELQKRVIVEGGMSFEAFREWVLAETRAIEQAVGGVEFVESRPICKWKFTHKDIK